MKSILFILSILGIQLYFLYNLQFTAWPEMLSYPYLRNEGFLLYKDMIHPYTPLLTIFLSIIYKFFGYELIVLKIIAWLIILFSSILVYWATYLLTKNKRIAFLSLAFYVFLQPFLEGNMLWFDMAIVPLVLCSMIFLLKWASSKRSIDIFIAGCFLGFAIFTKQTAGLFLVLSIIFLISQKVKLKYFVYFLLPTTFIGFALLVRLVQEKALIDFLNWTLIYPFLYWSKFPGYVQMSFSTRDITILTLFFTPVIFLICKTSKIREASFKLLLLFLLGSLISVYPRFSYFHFQSALAMFVIISFYLAKDWEIKKVVLGVLGILAMFGLLVHKSAIAQSWNKEARFMGGDDYKMADTIKSFSKSEDNIFLLGFPSQYYVIIGSTPPKRWTDNFGWYLEIPGVQEEILDRWNISPPDIVFKRTPSNGNWFDLGVYQPKKIVDYINSNYYQLDQIQEKRVEVWVRKREKM